MRPVDDHVAHVPAVVAGLAGDGRRDHRGQRCGAGRPDGEPDHGQQQRPPHRTTRLRSTRAVKARSVALASARISSDSAPTASLRARPASAVLDGCAELREGQVRQPRQRDVRRGLAWRWTALRWWRAVARRVVARRAGLLAAGFGVVVAAGAEGLTVVVVVTVADGPRRGADDDARLGLHRSRVRARRARPARRRVGARGLLRAGRHRRGERCRCHDRHPTQMWTRPHVDQLDSWPNRPYSRLRGPATAHPPFWVGERRRWPAGRPTQNRPTGPCRAVSPPSSRGPARAPPSGTPGVHRSPESRPGTSSCGCPPPTAPERRWPAGPSHRRPCCAARTGRVGVARVVLLRRGVRIERPGRSRPSGPAPGRSRHPTRRPDRPTGWSRCRCRPRTSPPTR